MGPSDKFTIHGLWPDNFDGSYPKSNEGCDISRHYNDLEDILQQD